MRFIRNLWWRFKNRCRDVREASLEGCPFTFLRLQHLNFLDAGWYPCKVCGKRTCKWSQAKPPEVSEREMQESEKRLRAAFHGPMHFHRS